MMKAERTLAKRKYEDAIEEYVRLFCEKHKILYPDADIWWVGDEPGTLLYLIDHYFNFQDIKLDVDSDTRETEIFEWYDYSLVLGELGAKNVTYENWLKGVRPYTPEQLEEIKKLHKKVEEAKKELLDSINTINPTPIN